MKLLLDTHTALWWANEQEKFSPQVKAIMLNEEHRFFFSIASAWEIAIKVSVGKLAIVGGIRAFFAKMGNSPISLLQVTQQHLEIVEALPFIHRDPFDRLLVAAAKAEGMTILTADGNIHKYDVPTVW
ncbi:MAG: type II toxin-antitoxin system VapC family toxin [Holophagales bacterium]|nr:type II toxin-antitoxin system VapC family toxin [Holophagales bacterium]